MKFFLTQFTKKIIANKKSFFPSNCQENINFGSTFPLNDQIIKLEQTFSLNGCTFDSLFPFSMLDIKAIKARKQDQSAPEKRNK